MPVYPDANGYTPPGMMKRTVEQPAQPARPRLTPREKEEQARQVAAALAREEETKRARRQAERVAEARARDWRTEPVENTEARRVFDMLTSRGFEVWREDSDEGSHIRVWPRMGTVDKELNQLRRQIAQLKPQLLAILPTARPGPETF